MAHYGLLGDYKFRDAATDIRGTTLYGVGDEKLGKIEDVIFDHATGDIRYVVVDTGGWLTTKEFIVPTERLRFSDKEAGGFASDLTKKQVESFPPYNESDLESHDKWDDYEGRYRAKWETGPVMHRAESDRNITPTTQQLQGNRSSIQAAGSAEPVSSSKGLDEASLKAASAPTERIVPAGMDSVVINNGPSGIGPRWDTFQDRLRERRKEAVMACVTCGTSEEHLKKAG